MYFLKPGIKQDPVRRWNLPDRIFFGHGACHILAHAFLEKFPNLGFRPVWIRPKHGHSGNHVFVTDGKLAFDYHGYSQRDDLLRHHFRGWSRKYSGWDADLVDIIGDLTVPDDMMAIGMHIRGPNEFLNNALPRARKFLDRFSEAHLVVVSNNQKFRTASTPPKL